MHLFASGYGWTKETVLSLPALDFIGYLTAIFQEQEEQILLDRRNSAFTGWQIYTTLKQTGFLGSSPLVKFHDYLGNLGLLKEEEQKALETYKKFKKQQNRREAIVNIAEARAIAESIKRQRGNNKK